MLTPYLRGSTWWAKGRVEYNGRPITGYLRESTGASDEAGARDWITEREDGERRRFLIGEEEQPLNFAGAVMMYEARSDWQMVRLSHIKGSLLVRNLPRAALKTALGSPRLSCLPTFVWSVCLP